MKNEDPQIPISNEVKRLERISDMLRDYINGIICGYTVRLDDNNDKKAKDLKNLSKQLVEELGFESVHILYDSIRNLSQNPQQLQKLMNDNPALKNLIKKNITFLEDVNKSYAKHADIEEWKNSRLESKLGTSTVQQDSNAAKPAVLHQLSKEPTLSTVQQKPKQVRFNENVNVKPIPKEGKFNRTTQGPRRTIEEVKKLRKEPGETAQSQQGSQQPSIEYITEAKMLRARVSDLQKKLESVPTLGGGSYGRHSELAEQRRQIYDQVVKLVYDLTAHAYGEKKYTADQLNNKVKDLESNFNDLKNKVSNQLSNEMKIVLQQVDNQRANKAQNLPYKPEEYLTKLKNAAEIYGVNLDANMTKQPEKAEKNQAKRTLSFSKNNEQNGIFGLMKNFVKHIKANLQSLTQETKRIAKPKRNG